MKIYHGSQYIIEKPEIGKGKVYNDYGLGFYCTQSLELAKEWSCDNGLDGFANCYNLNTENLKILNLNDKKYTILSWLTLLIKNRTFRITNELAKSAKQFLLEHYNVDISSYDVIIGYRADDSYFAFAEDFLNNSISLPRLEKAMRLGKLGEQVVLKSQKAFEELEFFDSLKADSTKYFTLKIKRNEDAREMSNIKNTLNEQYILDIMRQGVKDEN